MSSIGRSYVIPNPNQYQPSPAEMLGRAALPRSASSPKSTAPPPAMSFLGRYPTSAEDEDIMANAGLCYTSRDQK
jgi:hypothetical protein